MAMEVVLQKAQLPLNPHNQRHHNKQFKIINPIVAVTFICLKWDKEVIPLAVMSKLSRQ